MNLNLSLKTVNFPIILKTIFTENLKNSSLVKVKKKQNPLNSVSVETLFQSIVDCFSFFVHGVNF